MEIVLFGLSHKTAPVEVREKFSIPKEQVEGLSRAVSEFAEAYGKA